MNDSITLTFPNDFPHLFDERFFRRLLLHYIVWTSINPPDDERDDQGRILERVEQLLERVSGHAMIGGINFGDALYHLLGEGLVRVAAAHPRHVHHVHHEGMSVDFHEPSPLEHVNCRFTSPDMSPFEVQAQPGVVLGCPACRVLNEQLCAEIEQPEPYHDDATDAVEAPKLG